jgi:hypothetical protein
MATHSRTQTFVGVLCERELAVQIVSPGVVRAHQPPLDVTRPLIKMVSVESV